MAIIIAWNMTCTCTTFNMFDSHIRTIKFYYTSYVLLLHLVKICCDSYCTKKKSYFAFSAICSLSLFWFSRKFICIWFLAVIIVLFCITILSIKCVFNLSYKAFRMRLKLHDQCDSHSHVFEIFFLESSTQKTNKTNCV